MTETGRPARHRHRAPRGPPHRPAASRPLRPPGRSRQQPLLSVAGRRPDADVRRRVGQELAHPAGHEGRRGDRKPHGLAAASKGAQKKVEERNFETRKNLLEYDEVMDEQRKRVYGYPPANPGRRQLQDQDHLDMIDRADRHASRRVPGQRLRHGDLRQVGRQRVGRRVRRPRFSRPRFRGRRSDWPTTRPSGRPRARSSTRWKKTFPTKPRTGRLELGSPGQVRQHPLASEPSRPRPEEDRPRPARRVPDRESPRGDRRGRSDAKPPVPRSRITACAPPAAG